MPRRSCHSPRARLNAAEGDSKEESAANDRRAKELRNLLLTA